MYSQNICTKALSPAVNLYFPPNPVLTVMSMAVLPWLSFHGCPTMAVQSHPVQPSPALPCSLSPVQSGLACLVLFVQSSLSSSVCPVQSILFCLSCSVCPVLSVLFFLSCSVCPVLSVLFCLSCSVFSVLSFLFCLSCSVCPVLSFLFCLSCSIHLPCLSHLSCLCLSALF
jgi:hypothetical protein